MQVQKSSLDNYFHMYLQFTYYLVHNPYLIKDMITSLISEICTFSISAMLLNRTKSCYGVQKLKINHDNNGKATTESCRRKINLKQENKTITRNNGCKERWLQTSSTFEMSFLKRQKQKNKINEHEIRYVHISD